MTKLRFFFASNARSYHLLGALLTLTWVLLCPRAGYGVVEVVGDLTFGLQIVPKDIVIEGSREAVAIISVSQRGGAQGAFRVHGLMLGSDYRVVEAGGSRTLVLLPRGIWRVDNALRILDHQHQYTPFGSWLVRFFGGAQRVGQGFVLRAQSVFLRLRTALTWASVAYFALELSSKAGAEVIPAMLGPDVMDRITTASSDPTLRYLLAAIGFYTIPPRARDCRECYNLAATAFGAPTVDERGQPGLMPAASASRVELYSQPELYESQFSQLQVPGFPSLRTFLARYADFINLGLRSCATNFGGAGIARLTAIDPRNSTAGFPSYDQVCLTNYSPGAGGVWTPTVVSGGGSLVPLPLAPARACVEGNSSSCY